MAMNDVKCPVCGEAGVRQKHLQDYQNYSLYECDICFVQYWQPFKNPGAEWYKNDPRYAGRNKSFYHPLNKNHQYFLNQFKSRPGKLLDIGCGTGEFLAKAQELNFEVYGIDFDPDAISKAKDTYQLSNLEVCSIEEYAISNPNIKFAYITFFDLLEHLDNPKKFITIVKNILKIDGFLALTVPDRNMVKFLKPHDLPPRHLTRWSVKSLKNFFSQNGFEIISVKKIPISFHRLSLKLKFRFGALLNWGLINKIEKKLQTGSQRALEQEMSQKLSVIRKLAKVKDLILFFIPSLLIYLFLLLFNRQSLTIYLVAKNKV